MDVVLVTPRFKGEKPSNKMGVAIIKQALKENNIKVRTYGLDEFNPSKLKKPSIVGFSSYYEYLDEMLKIAKKLEGHFVVFGGQGIYHGKTNKRLLDSGFVHALNYGHAAPFINLVKRRNENNLIKVAEEEGLITKNQLKVKRGNFPDIKKFPITFDERGFLKKSITIPAFNRCHNNCDYCIESLFKTPKEVRNLLIKSIKNYKGKIESIFFGNPTFNEQAWDEAEIILNVIKGKPETTFCVDSNDILNNFDKIKEKLDYFNTNASIGLNAINNKTASYVGRNTKGIPRTTIEEEKKAILKLIKERNLSRKEKYIIDILTSRAYGKKEIKELIFFISNLLKTGLEKNKQIKILIMRATPYPTSKFFERAKNDFENIDIPIRVSFSGNTSRYTFNNKSTKFFSQSKWGIYFISTNTMEQRIAGLEMLIKNYKKIFDEDIIGSILQSNYRELLSKKSIKKIHKFIEKAEEKTKTK